LRQRQGYGKNLVATITSDFVARTNCPNNFSDAPKP
jgi:hypothetical protein